MAHMIENRDGQYSFVENGKEGLAWHKLGKHFMRPLSAEEALKECRADYEVEKRSIANLSEEQLQAIKRGEAINISIDQLVDGYQGITRNDTLKTLGIVKTRYEVMQNVKAFEFIDFLTTGELGQKASIDCAGVLGNGERIFITAKFLDGLKIEGDDTMDMYAVFANSFDGSSPVCCMITPIRVVCNNTLNMAFGHNTGRLAFRHTKSINNRIIVNNENMKHACETLKLLQHYSVNLKQRLEQLGNIKLTEEKTDQILKSILLPKNMSQNILKKNNYDISGADFSSAYRNKVLMFKKHIQNGIGQKSKIPSDCGLYFINGVTTAIQNGIRPANVVKEERKFQNIMTGNYYALLNEAADQVMAMA